MKLMGVKFSAVNIEKIMMGVLGGSSLVAITIVLCLILNDAKSYGGESSSYIRTTFPTYNSTDMAVISESF